MTRYDPNHTIQTAYFMEMAEVSHFRHSSIRSEAVIRAVCINHGVTRKELLSTSRAMHSVRARWSAMFVLRQVAGWSLPRIALSLRRKDHTTVMNGLKRVEDHMRVDADFRDAVGRVRLAVLATRDQTDGRPL